MPKNLWIMAAVPHQESDPQRQRHAPDIISTSPSDIYLTARKVRAKFEEKIKFTADTGELRFALWSLLRLSADNLKADVQELVGVYSFIKVVPTRARRINLELLDTRVQLKKALGLGSRNAPSKWSLRRVNTDPVFEAFLLQFGRAYEVLGDADRYEPNVAARDFVNPLAPIIAKMLPDTRTTPALRWVSLYNMLWHRGGMCPELHQCFTLGTVEPNFPASTGMRAYACVDKHDYTGTLCLCTL